MSDATGQAALQFPVFINDEFPHLGMLFAMAN
jgi:hypothetical protein